MLIRRDELIGRVSAVTCRTLSFVAGARWTFWMPQCLFERRYPESLLFDDVQSKLLRPLFSTREEVDVQLHVYLMYTLCIYIPYVADEYLALPYLTIPYSSCRPNRPRPRTRHTSGMNYYTTETLLSFTIFPWPSTKHQHLFLFS